MLAKAVSGLPETHRQEIRDASLVSGAGCIATAGILALRPLAAAGVLDPAHVVVDGKSGSSAGAGEPFVRIVKESGGVYRMPEPKILAGTNYCDVGFAIDAHAQRVVAVSALDNLMKGAAGSAVPCMKLMSGDPA